MSPAMCWQNIRSVLGWMIRKMTGACGAWQVCQFIHSVGLQTLWQVDSAFKAPHCYAWCCPERVMWMGTSLPRRTEAVQQSWLLKGMFSEISGFVALARLSCNSKRTSLFMCWRINHSLTRLGRGERHPTTSGTLHSVLIFIFSNGNKTGSYGTSKAQSLGHRWGGGLPGQQ